jgi:predicted nuclease of restriction endonuclease-like RecB superfamily
MLSVEHVRVRRSGERLLLTELSAKQRARALELGRELIQVFADSVGKARDDVEQLLELVETRASERKLCLGLTKLLEDECEFEQLEGGDPSELRRDVFLRAARARREASPEQPFDRVQVLESAARERGFSPSELEAGLYADLRGAHRLVKAPVLSAEQLVERYQHAQVQAVLLRAASVVATVRCSTPDAYRALFHKLKFRKLLYRLEREPDGAYRIHIDGPLSLFDAVAKYGLELSLLLPALQNCDVLELRAKILWGKQRTALDFEHRHLTPRPALDAELALRDDVAQLLEEFNSLNSNWRARPASEILELPGFGSCIPDLVFERTDEEGPVYLELMGYWSRDAVFRRVELVERGLQERIVFALSSKLRVSEQVLDSEHAALYVFRGKPSARAVEQKLNEVARRSSEAS